MGFGGGFGWGGACPKCKDVTLADHAGADGRWYCKTHYLIVEQGHTECPGCLGTGKPHAHGLPAKSIAGPCNLCKGGGTLSP